MKLKKKYKIIIPILIIFIISIIILLNKNETNNFLSSVKHFFTGINGEPRDKYNFNYDWKFALGEGTFDSGSDYTHYCKINDHSECLDAKNSPGTNYEIVSNYSGVKESDQIYKNDYDTTTDSRFTDVSLPHTYNETDSFDNYNEGAQNGDRSMYSGTGWYKKQFFAPESYRDKKIYIEFEAARQAMNIYINGTKVEGTYENGFIPVGYDLTPYINIGEKNYITVEVDNTYPYYMKDTINASTTSKVLWHNSHWHPNYGGLYRNSYLYVVDNLHLTLPLYSFIKGEGTYIYTSNITTDENKNTSATINIDAQVENNNINDETFYIKSTILDKDNNEVGSVTSESKTLTPNSKKTYHLEKNISNVKVWSTDYPYLYKVKTEIIKGSTIIDNNSDEIGIRTFRFTNDQGFYLNENHQELNGWGQKSTMEWAGLGSAYPDWMTDYVIKKMKDANANYIRWGHTAGSPKQIESCEKYGILVTQPGVDGEGNSEGNYDTNNAKLRIEALRDMIIYFRNSPSIIMWELGNQASVSTTLNETYINSISGLKTSKTSATMYELLYTIINQYDYGNRDNITNSGNYDTTTASDDRLITIRRGNSTVSGYVENEETTLGDVQITGKTYVEGEYNRLESPRGVWDKYTSSALLKSISSNSEYYKNSEDYAISQIKDMGMVTGQSGIVSKTGGVGGANWIFSDSESHARITTEVTRTSGEVDAVMLEKEAYYVDQVIFNKKPAIHIIGHWNYNSGTKKTIYIAARNIEYVDLFVNDTKYTGTLSNGYLWTFNNVSFENGTITAKAYDKLGNVIKTDSVTTTGTPTSIKLTPIIGNEGLKANGSDIMLVDAEVVDSNNNRVLTYNGISSNDLITFNLNDETGTSIWRGGYNSGIENTTNKKTLYLESGINRISIRTTMKSGNITLNATSSSGLTSNTISINSESIDNTNGVSTLSTTSSYDLNLLTDPGVGNGEKAGEANTIETHGSTLITNMSYSGSLNDNNKINDALGAGSKIYSDENITFTSIPYKYYNSEYLMLPNADSKSIATDLINFTAKRNIDVVVLHDPNASIPDWLSSYIKLKETSIGGNGMEYDMYSKSFNKGDSITIGGNENRSNISNDISNQIILFKETEKVNNLTFFKEDFNDFDEESLSSNWNVTKSNNTNIEVDNTFNGNTIHLTDSISTDLTYLQKSFTPLTDRFKISFKAYLTTSGTSNNNNWLRFYLSNGKMKSEGDKSNLAVESYINTSPTNLLYYSARTHSSTATVNDTTPAISGIDNNTWHTYEVDLDLDSKTYDLYVDGVKGIQTFPQYVADVTSVDTFVIGTWKGGNSDYYVDDIEITPIISNVITNVKIDDNIVNDFNTNNNYYHIKNLTKDSLITFDTTDYYQSHTIEYDSTIDALVLTVKDVNNIYYTYKFYNLNESTLLEGWTLNTTENTNIKIANKDGNDTIYFTDDSASEEAYIGKSIGSHTKKFYVSYDAYVTNVKTNIYLRMWLGKGIINDLTKSNVGIANYLDRNLTNLEFHNETNYSSSLLKGTNNKLVSGYNLNTWNNFKIFVNVETKKYDVYINDTLAYEGADFLQPIDDLNYIVIGTGRSSTSDYYVKNINVETIYESPIEDIKINNDSLIDFNKDKLDYSYYTEDKLTDSTVFDITKLNDEYDHFIVERNLIEQKAIIKIYNKKSIEFKYTITFLNPATEEKTLEDLRNIIDQIDLLDKNSFSESSWNVLKYYVTEGNDILAKESPTSEEISLCFNNILTSKHKLIIMNDYTDYQTDLFDNFKYSTNLEGKFTIEKILDNDKYIYKDSNITFRSIPKKYINAEYFKINNEIINTLDSFNFDISSLKNVSILVFKDIKSGILEDTNYTFTGDIVTSSNGIVYKVYKQDINPSTNFSINYKTLINNRITNNNNIIAFKDSDEVNNNNYLKEDFSKYSNLDNLSKKWIISNEYPEYNDIRLEEKNGIQSLYLKSTSNSSNTATTYAAWAYLNFANQNAGKFKVNYKFFADETVPISYNGYTRVWINNNLVLNQNDLAMNADKKNTIVESYIDYSSAIQGGLGTSKLKLMYRTASANLPINKTELSRGTWYPVSYIIDLDNKKWSVNVNEETIENLGFTNDLTPANIFYLSNRKTGPTSMWFADIEIEPLELNYITNIQVKNTLTENLTDINDYTSLTKDYLVRLDDITNKEVILTEDEDDSTISSINNNEEYTSINTTLDGTSKQNNRVYYELNTNKNNLTIAINDAQSLDNNKYTSNSWTSLEIVLNNSIEVLKNLYSTQNEIDTATSNLRNSINSLQLLDTLNLFYTGKLYYGNNLENLNENSIYITNKSSITLNASMDITVNDNYEYKTTKHNRKLVSNKILPSNTKITMLDRINNKIYYYLLTETTSEINLEDFIEIGTINKHFINNSFYNAETNKEKEDFDFIIDFAETSNFNGEYKIKLVSNIDTTLADMTYLSYLVTDELSSYSMNSGLNKEKYTSLDNLNLNIITNYLTAKYQSINAIDTTRFNKNYGLKVTLYKNDEQINLPKGTIITSKDYNCYNSNNACIIKLNDINSMSEQSTDLLINFGEYETLNNGSYKLKLELIESDNGLNYGNIVSTNEVEFSINNISNPSLKTELSSQKNILSFNSSNTLNYNISTLNNENDILVYLEKKVDSLYNLIDLKQFSTNSLNTYSTNKYNIGKSDTFKLNLNDKLSKGTYKLTFEILNNEITTKRENYFIVK